MDFEWMTDAEIMKEIGRRVHRARLDSNFTQQELSADADISVNALKNIEAGRGYRMESFIKALRILRGLNALDQLLPDPPEFDLITRAKMTEMMDKKKRKRARGRR